MSRDHARPAEARGELEDVDEEELLDSLEAQTVARVWWGRFSGGEVCRGGGCWLIYLVKDTELIRQG